MQAGKREGVTEGFLIGVAVVERNKDSGISAGREQRRCFFGHSDRDPSCCPGTLAKERPEANEPKQGAQGKRAENGEPEDEWPPFSAGPNPVAELVPDEPNIQGEDEEGAGPGRDLEPAAVRKGTHEAAITGEVDERYDGEGQLKAENDLAENDEPGGSGIAGDIDGGGSRSHGEHARDAAPEPGPHAELQETLHDDLSGHGSRKSGGLPGAEKGKTEHEAGDTGAEQGGQQLIGLADVCDSYTAGKEDSGCHDEDRGIDEERAIQRDRRIDEVEAASSTLLVRSFADAAGLYEGRMEIQVMRHHGCAEYANSYVEALTVDAREQAGEKGGHIWPRKKYLDRETGGDGGDEGEHEGFDDADAKASEPEDEQGIGGGKENADEQRQVKKKVETDSGSENLGEVTGNDGEFAEDPKDKGNGARVLIAAGLGEIAAGNDSEPGTEGLKEQGHDAREDQDPEKAVAEASASFEVGGPIAGVHVADTDQVGGTCKGEQAPPERVVSGGDGPVDFGQGEPARVGKIVLQHDLTLVWRGSDATVEDGNC